MFVHQPKCGGTFVREALRTLRANPRSRLAGYRVFEELEKHRIRSEIPATAAGLPVICCVRDPFIRLISQYEFGWWKRALPPWVDMEAIVRRIPEFPDLSFREFVVESSDLLALYRCRFSDGVTVGIQTEQFLRFYARAPGDLFGRFSGSNLGGFERQLSGCHFLMTSRLNTDLAALLQHFGEAAEDVAFVHDLQPVRPPGFDAEVTVDWSASRTWRDYYEVDLLDLVARRERVLLSLFPELRLSYEERRQSLLG